MFGIFCFSETKNRKAHVLVVPTVEQFIKISFNPFQDNRCVHIHNKTGHIYTLKYSLCTVNKTLLFWSLTLLILIHNAAYIHIGINENQSNVLEAHPCTSTMYDISPLNRDTDHECHVPTKPPFPHFFPALLSLRLAVYSEKALVWKPNSLQSR